MFIVLLFPFSSLGANERFPEPLRHEIDADAAEVYALGKSEVFELPYTQLAEFLWNHYIRGPDSEFHYFDCNPIAVSQDEKHLPATILLHASQSNQGEWLPLLASLEYYKNTGGKCGPIFTFNFDDQNGLIELIKKIEDVQKRYLRAGQKTVALNLVGHSLGGIIAAEYAYSPELWVPSTLVTKVITLASRLKNLDIPKETPHYPYCYDILERVDSIWDKIQQNRGLVPLYTLAAEKDWLLPHEVVLIGDEQAIAPNSGHALINMHPETREQIIHWLFKESPCFEF